MSLLWITLLVSIVVNDGVNAAVVVRRRPISIQERIPFTTQATTTTTTLAPEDNTAYNRVSRLTLPSNATSIRSDITDNFSCAGRPYGYYADVENDCQIFHVCLPVTYPDGQGRQFRWSFICPEETTFNQEAFTCVRTDEMNFDCTDSEKFYELNRILGLKEETSTEEITSNELTPISPNESNKSNLAERFSENRNKENNQRFKVPAPPAVGPVSHSNYISSQTLPTRNQIAKKPTTTPYISTFNTERAPQTTNFHELNIDRSDSTTQTDFIPSTTFPPINIAQFFDLTTRKNFNYPTTTVNDESEFTTNTMGYSDQSFDTMRSENDISTMKYDSITRFVPDLLEETTVKKNTEQSKADEVVESIKQLQKLFPTTVDDSREKRFLFKSDSVKNRQKLFQMLNH